MDPISILKDLKNKVLDAANYECLERAYDIQDQNIKQLKINNDALKESNKLLQSQVNCLRTENESLKQSVGKLSKKSVQADDDSLPLQLSKGANDILNLYSRRDSTKLYMEKEIIPALKALGFNNIQIESAIDELKNTNMIKPGPIDRNGTRYSLTEQGKRYFAQNTKN